MKPEQTAYLCNPVKAISYGIWDPKNGSLEYGKVEIKKKEKEQKEMEK
jgi:hypothetical protein